MVQLSLTILVLTLAVLAIIVIYLGAGRWQLWHEWKARGMPWTEFVKAAEEGDGCIILDHAMGRARGLGIVVWWSPVKVSDSRFAPVLIAERCRLTDCPKDLKSIAKLRARFPRVQVLENYTVTL